MAIGIVGRKCGMTRVFDESGSSIPVTVIHATPNLITQIKSEAIDGYSSVQVTTGAVKTSRVSKASAGHFMKAGVDAGRGRWEFRIDEEEEGLEIGSSITVERFTNGQKVDVTGTSKGKGFQGGVKRWNFGMQDATHGNSLSHRSNGSIGQNQTPGRVFKGKKMSGQMGNVKSTTQNLTVVNVDVDKNLLLIKGAVPGCAGGDIIIRPAIKAN